MFAILQSKTKYYALQSTELRINGHYFYLIGKYFIQTGGGKKSYRWPVWSLEFGVSRQSSACVLREITIY
jgi:hypothetical protein